MKRLIKDHGIKPGKIATYLKTKKNPRSHQIELKKELIKIKDIIKKASNLQIK